MLEILIFLLAGNIPVGLLFLLLRYRPVWARRLALWSCIGFFLLVEWGLLSFRVGFHMVLPQERGFLCTSGCALAAFTLCSLAVCGLLLRLVFPALREYVLPRATTRGLLIALFTLLPLQLALFMDAFAPVFGGPLGMGFSLCVAAAVAFLALWGWGVARLRGYLSRGDRRYVRKAPHPVKVVLTPPAPRRPFLMLRRKRALIGFVLPLLLLTPLFFIEWREPKTFPPEVQQAMDDIFQVEIRKHTDLFPPGEMEALCREFTLSGDANTRSRRSQWSMLHLACWFDKPELTEYLLRHGADVNAATLSRDGWAGAPPFAFAVSNVFYHRSEAARRNVELLLARGVDVNCSGTPYTPLLDCTHEKDGEEMFLLLLDHGAQVEETPVHPYLYLTSELGWVRATRRLLELKAPMFEEDETPVLVGAARGAHRPGALECARMLLEAGCDVNEQNEDTFHNALMALMANPANPDEDAAAVERTGKMVLLFLAEGAQLQEPWVVSPRARYHLSGREYAKERQREGRTVAEVLQEERPQLAAWLREHGEFLLPR